MFGHLKYNSAQKEIIKNCINKNRGEYDKWYFHNLIYPICIILLSIVLISLVKQDFTITLDYILNGSISLLGLNVLFAMSSYLIRVKSFQKDELKKDVLNLSSKLNDWTGILIVIGSILYVLPILYSTGSIYFKIALLVLSIITLIISIKISAKMFMIRDDFYQKTYSLEESFEKVIMKETDDEHGKNWN